MARENSAGSQTSVISVNPSQRLQDETTIVLIGKSGAGKSTLVKNVFGVDEVDTEISAERTTTEIKTYRKHKNGVPIAIIDTVGVPIAIIDTVGFESVNKKQIKKQLKELSKHTGGKADLVIYCLPISPSSKFDDFNPDIMAALQDAFGKDIWNHCLVILTFSNVAWSSINDSNPNNIGAAMETYKRHVNAYVEKFKQALQKLKEEKVKVKSILAPVADAPAEGAPGNPDGSCEMLFIPAGHLPEDQVMADIKYTATSQRRDHEVQHVDTNKWADVLTYCVLERKEVGSALLQFWYGRDRIEQVMREGGYFNTMVGGGTTGMVVGGAAGTATGAVVGALAGPFGFATIPVGAGVGLVVGVLVGSVTVGGGATAVTMGVAKLRKKLQVETFHFMCLVIIDDFIARKKKVLLTLQHNNKPWAKDTIGL